MFIVLVISLSTKRYFRSAINNMIFDRIYTVVCFVEQFTNYLNYRKKFFLSFSPRQKM